MLKTDSRHTLPRRLMRGAVKSCVAVGALVGAANWAAKGYPPPAPAAPVVAARAPLPADEPVTTGSIVPRSDARSLKAATAAADKPAPEKIVARVPDFDSRALAALAAGTTPAQAGTPPVRKEAARKDAPRKEADQARR